MTHDMSQVTCDTWHVAGVEPSLKILAPYLLQFGSEDIFTKDQSLNELIMKVCVCRKAPSTPGLINIAKEKVTTK